MQVRFEVADATNLSGYDGRFDTVIDSALYHCLDDAGRQAYAAGLHRATRPDARWHLYCFSDGNINGVVVAAPMGAVPESNIRDTLTANGWRIDFLGPTSYLASAAGLAAGTAEVPTAAHPSWPSSFRPRHWNRCARWPPGSDRQLLDDDRVYLPFTVVHAHRVD